MRGGMVRTSCIVLGLLTGLSAFVVPAKSQSTLLQAGSSTAGHAPMYVGSSASQVTVQDSGPASGGSAGVGLRELNVTARGTGTAPYAGQGTGPNGEIVCFNDAPTNNSTGYHSLCFSANAQGGGLISYGANGAASALSLNFLVNGTTYEFPFSVDGVVGPSTSVVNDAACWNNTTGTLLKDCGAFVTVAGTNAWTGTNSWSGNSNFTGVFRIGGTTQTFPASGNIVGTSDTQTLTNKSIVASQINSGTLPATVMPALTGDVTSSAGAVATTLASGVVTNAKLAAASSANTVKGAATSTTVTDLTVPSCSAASNALQWLNGTGFQCGTLGATTAGWGIALSGGGVISVATAQPPYSFDVPINMGLTASVGASALTINLTGANGSAPSATNPVSIPFRSTTLATGTPSWTAVTSALSITIPSAATLGTSNNVPFRIWIFAAYNAGVPELGVAVCSSTTTIYPCTSWLNSRKTTITIDGFSTSSGVLYATTGVSNDSVRIIGYAEYSAGLATAGSWASVPTTLQIFGPGIAKPGDVIQTVSTSTTTEGTTTSATYAALSSGPSVSITPSSAINLVHLSTTGSIGNTSSSTTGLKFARNSTAIGPEMYNTWVSFSFATSAISFLDSPQLTSAITYQLFGKTSAGTLRYPNTTSNAAAGASIIANEIMGVLPEPANDNAHPGVFSLTG